MSLPARPAPILLALLAAASPLHAQAVDPVSLRINGNPVEARLGFVGENILRFQFLPISPQGDLTDSPDEPHLVPQKWRQAPLTLRSATPVTQTVGGYRLSFDPTNPDTWTILLSAPAGTTRITLDPASGQLSFPIEGPTFGLGQGGKPHDRRGAINTQLVGGWENNPFPLNDWGEHLGIPWIVSPSIPGGGSAGIYFHAPNGHFDLTGPRGRFLPQAPAGRRGATAAAPTPPRPIDGFIVLAADPIGVMKGWAEITGYPSLPPIWSLGYIQSHREIESPEQILGIAKTFREKQLPCDMLIYLGTGFAPIGWNTDHGEFVFHEKSFPRPAEQLAEFEKLHFKVALHVTPRGANPPRRLAGRVADPIPADTPYDPNNVAQYWGKHAPLMKMGVDAWWPDEGEGPIPAPRLARVQMYWEGPQQLFPDQRPYALHRTGAVGMARYGGWLWSGDIKSTWEVLARQVPLGLNISAGGTPYWGTDTGGFYQDARRELTGELFARWFQFSTFCPLFRSHGRDWRFRHLPWGFSDIEGPDRDSRIEEICRTYLDLRYRLMPYTYSLVYAGHEDGMPLMRAMWMHHPADPAAVARGDQYLWGRDLLVAPIVEKGATQRNVYLPAGRWYDFWTGEPATGGREITRAIDLATMPIYIRAGALIPLGPKENYTLEKANDPLTLQVYPGADGKFVMIEDDGLTFSSKPMRLGFAWDDNARRLRIALEGGTAMRDPLVRQIVIKLIGGVEKSVSFQGAPVEVQF